MEETNLPMDMMMETVESGGTVTPTVVLNE